MFWANYFAENTRNSPLLLRFAITAFFGSYFIPKQGALRGVHLISVSLEARTPLLTAEQL
ncbi:MAG: hypothetical protein EAZ30_10830 [Betaproteobacteria bacterium]|nr:MAG: hypothetical protein EAZ30_10830 [Betaproteobacteria bacterium]